MAVLREDVMSTAPITPLHIFRMAEIAVAMGMALHMSVGAALGSQVRFLQVWWLVLLLVIVGIVKPPPLPGWVWWRRAVLLGVIGGVTVWSRPDIGLWVWLPTLTLVALHYAPVRVRTSAAIAVAIAVWLAAWGLQQYPLFAALLWGAGVAAFTGSTVWIRYTLDRVERLLTEYELTRAALDFLPDLIAVKDPTGRYLLVNRALREGIQRHGGQTVTGKHAKELFPAALANSISATDQLLLETRSIVSVTEAWQDATGQERWQLTTKAPLLDKEGNIIAIVGSARDVTDLKQAELQVAQERNLLRSIIDNAPLTIIARDHTGEVVLANAEATRVMKEEFDRNEGVQEEVWIDRLAAVQPGNSAMPPPPPDVPLDDVAFSEITYTSRQGQKRWRQLIFAPWMDTTQRPRGLITLSQDITPQKELQHLLEMQANHDPITGLMNRRVLTKRIAAAIAKKPLPQVALLFCDLDHFKLINDSLGHDEGDRLLRAVALRFAPVMSSDDLLVRLGGDEFGVLCMRNGTTDYALALGQRMLAMLTHPIEVGPMQYTVGASIGVAVLRPDHLRPDSLIRDADTAMYLAKEHGRNEVALFDDSLRQRVQRRLELTQALRTAVAQEAFDMVFQPTVTLTTRRLTGFEALTRWTHPHRGVIAPDEFIRIAEETGQIIPLGVWVLKRACRQLAAWQKAYASAQGLVMSVNVSIRQLQDARFVGQMAAVLAETGLDPACLQLEITESDLMANPSETIHQLQALKQLRVRLAVDDFGTGYSSLAHLRYFPVDVLKIDRTLVADVDTDTESHAIVRMVVELAAALAMEVIAEGVERESQAQALIAMGCAQAQGYAYAHPLTVAAVEGVEWLAAERGT